MCFLILHHIVVTLFTFCTFQCDSCAHNFHLASCLISCFVLHGSLRDCPFLGIKKRPTSIRLSSIAWRTEVRQVFFKKYRFPPSAQRNFIWLYYTTGIRRILLGKSTISSAPTFAIFHSSASSFLFFIKLNICIY